MSMSKFDICRNAVNEIIDKYRLSDEDTLELGKIVDSLEPKFEHEHIQKLARMVGGCTTSKAWDTAEAVVSYLEGQEVDEIIEQMRDED